MSPVTPTNYFPTYERPRVPTLTDGVHFREGTYSLLFIPSNLSLLSRVDLASYFLYHSRTSSFAFHRTAREMPTVGILNLISNVPLYDSQGSQLPQRFFYSFTRFLDSCCRCSCSDHIVYYTGENSIGVTPTRVLETSFPFFHNPFLPH